MNLWDMEFWLQSARSDARLARLQIKHGIQGGFNYLYSEKADPWGYLTRRYRYQRLKYQKMEALLPAKRFASALDIGCGIGVFSRMLAPQCDRVLGVELSQAAVENAAALSNSSPNVAYVQGELFDLPQVASGPYDLIILADVLYYLSPLSDEVLHRVNALIETLLAPGGFLLLANHFFFDLDPQSRVTRQIHASFRWNRRLNLLSEERHPFFLCSLLEKRTEIAAL